MPSMFFNSEDRAKFVLSEWLFAPARSTSTEIKYYLREQLLSAPGAALMGSFCSLLVLLAAYYRSGAPVMLTFVTIEIVLSLGRLAEWGTRERRRRNNPDGSVDICWSVLLTAGWCALQGAVALTIMSGNDTVLQVLSATLIMAMIGPICARNYPAPRFATVLLLLCDLPFVAGAVLSNEPLLSLIVLLTPPFIFGAWQIILTFHNAMLDTLLAQEGSRHLAMHDSLTGVLNRQGMDEKLGKLHPQHERTMAILSLDLDGFRSVNDNYGHGAGDIVLMEAARRIALCTGQGDIVARVGGDEFMIVVPGCGAAALPALGQALVDAICNTGFVLNTGTNVRIGASVGYACLPEDASSILDLRLKADQALYDAKEAGKSRCRRFHRRGSLDRRGAREPRTPPVLGELYA